MIFTENKRVKLRAVEPPDAELMYEWENDTAIWLVSNTIMPFSKHIIHKFIENAHQDIFETKQLRLMIDAKDIGSNPVTIGSIDLFDFEPQHQRAGVGILICNKNYRQRGYARGALELLIAYAFNILLLHQLYCNISSDNESSIRLFSSMGFKKIGVKKDWIRLRHGFLNEEMYQLVNKGNHQN
jgi:diamine N-acetyltransferase